MGAEPPFIASPTPGGGGPFPTCGDPGRLSAPFPTPGGSGPFPACADSLAPVGALPTPGGDRPSFLPHARQDSNLQPPVLETGALPIELRAYPSGQGQN